MTVFGDDGAAGVANFANRAHPHRLVLSRKQADYLRALQADAARAQDAFATALNAVALAIGDKGLVSYDFGPEPFVEVTPEE